MDAEELHIQAIPEEEVMVFSGKIIAENVAYEDYLSGKYGRHTEWIFGVVIAMSPINIKHALLNSFLEILFRFYLEHATGGKVLRDPFVMKPGDDFPARQPDIQIILPDRTHFIQETQVTGPANLVVEIVSPESVKRDRGEKFDEYERAGVDEYWLLDPQRNESLFYVRGENGLYQSRLPVDGVYTSHVLDRLQIKVSLFWEEELPDTQATMHMVEEMLAKK